MRNFILVLSALIIVYSCNETSGKVPGDKKQNNPVIEEANQQVDLQVRRAEARNMRRIRDKDTAVIKISARDLTALMAGSPAANDSFIFYLVRYDSQADRDRYLYKVPTANWNAIRGKSSLLVGYLRGGGEAGMLTIPRPWLTSVAVYDLGVVCPPPPNCGCEIMQ
jgi:hypothetical protein